MMIMSKKETQNDLQFIVTASDQYPKKKTVGQFKKRQQARQFCRNHDWLYAKLIIIHPNGTQEIWKSKWKNEE